MTLMAQAAPVWARPGLRWGLQPQREAHQAPWHSPFWQIWRQRGQARTSRMDEVQAIRRRQRRWLELKTHESSQAWTELRSRLAGAKASADDRDEALAAVAVQARQVLGRDPFDTQLLCARALLRGQLAEMATGEGKTLAVALAAAVVALAGVPVHVMTANDYLAQRDAQAHRPLFEALGLRVANVLPGLSATQRRAAYAADITYATAREIAFDSLRDGLARRGDDGRPRSELACRAAALAGDAGGELLQRGLCCALIDEADSLLIDEAAMPLVLAESGQDDLDGQGRAQCFQALALARQLQLGVDAWLEAADRAIHWAPAGLARLEELAQPLGGAWLHRRHREDLVTQALTALHALQPERDYLLIDGHVELLDRVSARRAPGRVWSRQLHTLVALKEGCKPGEATRTAARTSYPRFFARYHFVAGTSGTLSDVAAELALVQGLAVVRVPLRRPCRRVMLPLRCFVSDAQRRQAAVQRVAELHACGRPVLVGVASLEAAHALSRALLAQGLAHRVLDARHEADEATVVACAGQAGAVTVATAMAGRGTDIELGPDVAERGGLHVLNLMDSPCARTVRQLIGRCARQGDPGSAETWTSADAEAWQQAPWPCPGEGTPNWMLRVATELLQGRYSWQMRRQRRRILKEDLSWERRLAFGTQHA